MAPHTVQIPPQNRLLASLSEADYGRLRPHLEPVCLEYKRSLYEVNKPIEFVYFLETDVSSLVSTMATGDASEVGTIGNEGVVGLPILLGHGARRSQGEGWMLGWGLDHGPCRDSQQPDAEISVRLTALPSDADDRPGDRRASEPIQPSIPRTEEEES